MWNLIKPRTATLRFWQLGLLVLVFVFWHVMTAPGLIPPIMFDNDRQAAFFFGEPLEIFLRIWMWFVVDANIYKHLGITLVETILAFGIGASTGLMGGLWLALSPMASGHRCSTEISVNVSFNKLVNLIITINIKRMRKIY